MTMTSIRMGIFGFVAFGLLHFSPRVSAQTTGTTATITAVSGVSKFDNTNNNYKIYGGIAGTCAPGDISATTPCNTCKTSTGGLTPCNRLAIHSTLNINVTYTSVSALTTPTSLTLKLVAGTSSQENTLDTETSNTGKTYTFTTTWGAICSAINTAGTATGLLPDCTIDSDVTTDVNSTDHIFRIYEGTTKVAEASIVIHGISTNAGYRNIDNDYDGGNDSYGLRQYEFFPGDQKLILLEYPVSPATMPSGTPELEAVVFFLAPAATVEPPSLDLSLYGNANPSSPDFTWNATTSTLGATPYLEGLVNGATYCAIAGHMNKAQNIFLFTSRNIDAADAVKICKSPNEVVGLLDGLKCFISTAAFGSPMAVEVQKLRLFRDRILAKTQMGRAFIQWYYENSPPVANVIAKNETLRAITRAALYPILSFAEISLLILDHFEKEESEVKNETKL